MNGKITIDGYCEGDKIEIVIHGGERDPKSIASLTMEINRNKTVKLILMQMLKYVDESEASPIGNLIHLETIKRDKLPKIQIKGGLVREPTNQID